MKDDGLIYYRDRTGAPSGAQLTVPGFERYDRLSGGCPETNQENIDESELVEEAENLNKDTKNQYDVFISHAGEDKDQIARPLATELEKSGFNVWFDDFELQIGDNLRKSIDKGLKNSDYGAIILSEAFFGKKWPENELEGLLSLEDEGETVILPLWYEVGEEEVKQYSPTLAGRVAGEIHENNIDQIADSLSEVLRS